jgi:hypothetical protein
MKNIFTLIILLLACGLVKAQSNREDIEINWPKADGWELDKSLSIQTDFAHRHQKWDIKHDGKESWQKMILILDDDITKNTISLDSVNVLLKDIGFNLLEEKKNISFPYKLISMENRKIKSEQTPISTLIYITDGRTCRHVIQVSERASKFSADFLKQWSAILLHSRIVPSKAGNFELTGDAFVDIKELNGTNINITANFKSDQVKHLLKGQSAKIVMEAFPELSLSGKISEISNLKNKVTPNPPGNFVKTVERFPVTIKTEVPAAMKDKFRNGMSCTVTVDTAP